MNIKNLVVGTVAGVICIFNTANALSSEAVVSEAAVSETTVSEVAVSETAVSEAEPEKIIEELTVLGAEVSANADESIPAWTGSMLGVPAGLTYKGSGDNYPDPYASEKMLYRITAANMNQYSEHMSEGVKALLEKYSDTFYLPVYPSHRDGRNSKLVEDRTQWNATATELVNGLDGLQNYTGGAPFRVPKNGAEVMWNGRLAHPHPTITGIMDEVAVYPDGRQSFLRYDYVSEFPYSYAKNKLGDTEEKIGINAAYVLVTTVAPARQKGQITVDHEALDQVKGERRAWVYIPGSRRVRRAPTVGFDTPNGPGGLMTVDDALGFNGAFTRFDWKLIGKKEMYIPYHNYKFDTLGVDYQTLLTPNHPNPEYMRYEKHRVWVVEANLKVGARHVYGKRRFYLDEDSWHIVLVESYDGRGDLWRVGVMNTVYDYAVQGYIARAQTYHDLQAAAYVTTRLVNEKGQPNLLATPKGDKFFTPSNLRKMGSR